MNESNDDSGWSHGIQPGDGDPAAQTAPPVRLALSADLALRLCEQAFGPLGHGFPDPTPWPCLEARWRDRLIAETAACPEFEAVEAQRLLRESLGAQAQADLQRVHPTWLARALQEESPAVRGLLEPDAPGPKSPEVWAWVRSLWTERLVGGEPAADNDPPAIVALAELSPWGLVRLAQTIGLAKMVLAEAVDVAGASRTLERDRCAWLQDALVTRLGSHIERVRQWAKGEVQRAPADVSIARKRGHLGLTTLARLLIACEPFRVRWALQHLPYPIAKGFRAVMSSPAQAHPGQLRIEDVLLKTAWDRLTLEGRISVSAFAILLSRGDAS